MDGWMDSLQDKYLVILIKNMQLGHILLIVMFYKRKIKDNTRQTLLYS